LDLLQIFIATDEEKSPDKGLHMRS